MAIISPASRRVYWLTCPTVALDNSAMTPPAGNLEGMKSFSQSCENNKQPLLRILGPLLEARQALLEIGSGSGQHAAFFAAHLPQLLWQTSDVAANHASIEAWIDGVDNAVAPIALDVDADDWPQRRYDAAFSANTAHIMHWPSVVHMFQGVSGILEPGGVFALYGPFDYAGEHTSPGNQRFDRSLRAADAGMGIRDFEAVAELADSVEMSLLADHAMPANNRTLVWQRRRVESAS
jgi:SAM-dependent methyltransferase